MFTLPNTKRTVTDLRGKQLGIVECVTSNQFRYQYRRIRGYAESYAAAVAALAKLHKILPRTRSPQHSVPAPATALQSTTPRSR